MAMSGLTADARVLCKYMRNECTNYKFTYASGHPLNRLILKVADKSQAKTQNASKRPYGVGLLVAGVDKDGPHVFETCPSGNYYEYFAYAIGARSQSAKTYFENNLEQIKHAATA
jgi:20S proteasome subunit alpha 6